MTKKVEKGKPSPKEIIRKNPDIFDSILASFVFGLLRLNNARITFNAATIAIYEFHSKKETKIVNNPYKTSLQIIKEVSPSNFNSFTYISFISYLIYSTTLFDTFLSDCTKFLLLLFPNAVGKNQSITVEALLTAKSHSELINQAVSRKVREVSYLPFVGRIEFLKSTFGLKFEIDDETLKFLEHYSGLRNVAVHDQGMFELQLSDKGKLQAFPKSNFPHPTPVSRDDVSKAIKAYGFTVLEISKAIIKQILKDDKGNKFLEILNALELVVDSGLGTEGYKATIKTSKKNKRKD